MSRATSSFDALCSLFESAPWAGVFRLEDTEPRYRRRSMLHRVRAVNPPVRLDCEGRPGLTKRDIDVVLTWLAIRGWHVRAVDLAYAIEAAASRH